MAATIQQFSNSSPADRRLLREFVDLHWALYAAEPQYIPLLDYEYLGFGLLGIVGFFEPQNLFYTHAEPSWFLARNDAGTVTGRCMAFVNHDHNRHWGERTGFFGFFECMNDQQTADALVEAAAAWLRERGMQVMRGPQNLPVNESTPGLLTDGYDSRPVVYYHYCKRYYPQLLANAGLNATKRVRSWEVVVDRPMEPKLERVAQLVMRRQQVTLETWGERPLEERKREMLDIYNDAWGDNWGFVPFNQEEFYRIIDDQQLVIDKGQFAFAYVKGEPAAFFGGVPNIFDVLRPGARLRRFELLRALRMLLSKSQVKGLRLGYLGVKKAFRGLGLEGVLLWKQKQYTQARGYTYTDVGWVLEDNLPVLKMVEMMEGAPSKTYTVYERPL